ncbi:acyl-CoA dehydrogenase family protein [Actinoplanes sp. NPDC051470]|uniref:acyl-CoA dehydrogenase family protein n=1 Tax=Actinoplanes sp. NPDC051470 TaxID=3157224 RepID=UPI0034329346
MPDTSLDDTLKRTEELTTRLTGLVDAVDDGRADCRDSYRLAREAGLLGLVVPSAIGGDGLGFHDYTRVLELLATADAPTALGLNMHSVAIGALCESAGTPASRAGAAFREWVFDEVVNHQRMFASATSERGSGAKLRGLRTTYRATDHGFVLEGHKSFVSLAGVADYFVVAARQADGDADHEISHFVVSGADPGVRFGEIWPGTAMHGTSTADMTLDAVEVGRDRLFMGIEGMSLFKLVREPHWMVAGYTGVYLGLARSLFDQIVAAAAGRADDTDLRRRVGRAAASLRAARALVYEACAVVDEARGTVEANAGVHAAKYVVGELLSDLATTASRVCGAAGLRRGGTVERLLRESWFCAVMPAKPVDCLDYLGKTHLGVNMHDARSADW